MANILSFVCVPKHIENRDQSTAVPFRNTVGPRVEGSSWCAELVVPAYDAIEGQIQAGTIRTVENDKEHQRKWPSHTQRNLGK